jgi:hypothetical protein
MVKLPENIQKSAFQKTIFIIFTRFCTVSQGVPLQGLGANASCHYPTKLGQLQHSQ